MKIHDTIHTLTNTKGILKKEVEDTHYIYSCNGHYHISKTLKGRPVYYGCYKNLKTAQRERDKLIRLGWKRED